MNPIQFERVWKRYQIGTQHDSLRDTIPAFLKRLIHRNGTAVREEVFWALKDVSFEVRRGETLGIIGPNGAGKSTVLKLLSRITRQTTGRVAVHGWMAALIELGGGFHPDLTGAENIYLQGTMLGLSRRQIRSMFESIVAFSELEAFLNTPIKRYSSGMVVRLGFAIAAHIHPDVLLLDEVLAVGDLAFEQKCFKRIAELKAAQTTMIFISHDLEAVQKLCDRCLLLHHGQIIASGATAEIVQRYRQDVLEGRLKELSSGDTAEGPLQLLEVTLQDATGQAVDVCETGQALRVAIRVRADRPIRQPVVRVSLERLDGLLCHAASSHHAGLGLAVLEGRTVVTLEYPALNLLPNLYQVSVELFEGDSPVPLAVLRRGCCFQVTTDHHQEGAVHLEHRWRLG